MGSGGSAQKKQPFNQLYSISKELGTGAFSTVKLATKKATGEVFAVKIVNKKNLTPKDVDSLLTEIEILGKLNHPHIIKLYESIEEGHEYYILTELVNGGELFDRIVSKTHYTELEARNLVKSLLETVAYMHDSGIVHRDLKPENLLLMSETNDTNVKICDFGFAKLISELTSDETACGTPGYVAPEILRGDKYGAEVDIWSLGIIFYVMLAGYPPFYDEDQRKLFKKIKEGRYYFHEEYWSHISRDVIDLITKMLTVNQQERWTAKQLLEHPWVTANSDVLKNKSLDSSVSAMKKYNIRRKFKAAADAVIISNRIGKMIFRLMSIDPNALKESENVKSEEIAHDDVAEFLKKELEVVPEVAPEAGPDINA